MSQVSYGTITITDTNDIESITVEYARNQDPATAPSSGWSTTRPDWAQGYYIWQRTRIHKSGTSASSDTFGAAVCLTGSTGSTGASGRSLTNTVTQYTTATSSATITEDNMGSYTWSNNVPSYSSSTPAYWVRVTNTYSNPAGTQYIIYKDNGLTDAIYMANNATTIAQDAADTATRVEDLLGGHFIYGGALPQATPSGARVIEQIKENDVDVSGTPSKWHHNVSIGSNGISLRYNEAVMAQIAANQSGSSDTALKFYQPPTVSGNTTTQGALTMELSGNALKFFKPTTTYKAMELSGSGLIFYDASAANGGNIQAQFGNSGAIQSGDYAITNITDKFSTYGTKIDLTHGEIYSPYFRLSQGSVSGGPVAGIYMSGTFESTGALIGYQKISNSDTNAYWKIGYMTDTIQDKLTYQRADSIGFIELASSSTFILQKNKIHTAWFGNNGYLTYPQLDSKYYDFGMNLPTSLNDKFLYVRYNTGTNLSTIYQNDSGWVYPFYVDGEGKVHAKNFYIGDSTTPIGGGAGTIAEQIVNSDSTYGKGSTTQPIYVDSTGHVQVVGWSSETSLTNSDSKIPTSAAVKSFVEGKGYTTNTGTVTSVQVQASSPLQSSTNTAQTSTLNTTISFMNQNKNLVLAGPSTGSATTPSFRALVAADIPDLSGIYLTSYTETDPIFTASVAYGISSTDISNWNSKTSNTGTVTKVSTGVGLTGGDITSSGTIKANLTSDTKLNNAALSVTEDSTRIYPIRIDKNNKMVVVVPWTNVNSNYLTSSSTLNWNNVTSNRPTTLGGYGITDAKIANGVITLGGNTISKMPNPNALTIKVYNANTATSGGSTYSPTEISYDGSASGKVASVAGVNAITDISANWDSQEEDTLFTIVKSDGSSATFHVDVTAAVVTGATTLTDGTGVGLNVAGPVYFDAGTPKTMKPNTSTGLFLKDDGTWATPVDTTYTFDGTYDASSNKAATVSTVTNAINALDVSAQAGAQSKTITSISETNGKISVTYSDISITKSQITDFPTELTPASHTHGNIQNNGTLQTDDITIANGDKLVVTDSSNSNKIARTSLAFTTSTTKFLREDGQFATPNYTTNTDSKVSSSNSTSKLFLVGTTNQSSSGQTGYSNSAVYATNGALVATTYNGLTLTKATTGFTIAGGTTSKTLTVSENYTLGAACAKGVSDSSAAEAIGTGTNVTTERDVYYGLPTINNSHAYTSGTTIYAPTAGGTANTQALVGAGTTTAPKWVNISPSISITAGTASATPKINVTVLGQNGTAQSLTTASTSAYGATKLSSTSSSTEQGLAATPKLVYDSINNTVSNYVAKSGDTMTGTLTTPELVAGKIKADDVNVTHLLTAEGIQTKNWTAVNIATIDGSFYITPTISATTAKFNYTSTGTIELTPVSPNVFATNSLFIDGDATNWTQNSLIMITGSVEINGEYIPIGTIKGTLSGITTTTGGASKLTLSSPTTSIGNTPSILSLVTRGTQYNCKDIKVSIYSYHNNTNNQDNLLGIMMTTAGTKNRTYIDIYDGTHQTNGSVDKYDSNTTYTEPVVRIGNLRGINTTITNGKTPEGWGIYTTNGYFQGDVVAQTGYIGGYIIGTNDLTKGTTRDASGSFWLTPAQSTNSAMSQLATAQWAITTGQNFGVTTAGKLYATGANITGAIVATSLDLTTNNVKISSGSVNGLSPVATSGSYNDLSNKPTIPSLTGYIYQDGTVGSTPADGATGFVVSSAGALQASNAIIYGSLYASKGYVGGWQIGTDGNKSLHNGNVNTSPTPAANVVILSKGMTISATGNLPAATYAITSGTNFGVTTNGVLYSASGKIGGINISASSIYSGSKSSYNSSNTGFFLGSDGKFGVGTSTNYLTFDGTNVNVKGGITATSLTISSGATVSGVVVPNDISDMATNAKTDWLVEIATTGTPDFVTPSITLKAIVYHHGTLTTSGFTRAWYKNGTGDSLGSGETITVSDIDAYYICIISEAN